MRKHKSYFQLSDLAKDSAYELSFAVRFYEAIY